MALRPDVYIHNGGYSAPERSGTDTPSLYESGLCPIWEMIVVQPFAWLLRSLYFLTMNYGVAIILFSVVVKIVLLFFSFKSKRGTLKQQRLAPKQKELEKQFGKDKQKYQAAIAKLYQDEGVSPMGGCIWMLIPFPIIIALYSVVREPLKNIMQMSTDLIQKLSEAAGSFGLSVATNDGYGQLKLAQLWFQKTAEMQQQVPELAGFTPINFHFLGLDLAEIPHLPWSGGWSWTLLIPFLSAGTALLSVILNQKFSGMPAPQGNMKVMLLTSPVMSLWIGFIMPSALGLYWTVGNVLNIVQEYFLTKHFNKILDEEEARKAQLEERKRAAELKQREEDRQRRAERLATQKHKPKQYKLQSKPKQKPKPSSDDGSDANKGV